MRAQSTARRRWLLLIVLLAACVGLDQWTKRLAGEHLRPLPPLSFWGDTLRVQYAENPGAFLGAGGGLSERSRFWILVVLNAAFLALIVGVMLVRRNLAPWQALAAVLLVAGGVGNLIDRVFHDGLVIDFLNVGIGPLRTGIFNVADMAIMAGFAILIVVRSPAAATSETTGRADAERREPERTLAVASDGRVVGLDP
jgi:signal peptidase II